MLYEQDCGIFFFFKQKTAYEMRISDWSRRVLFRSNENGLLLIFKPQVRSLLGHRRYAGQAIGGQCYRPIVPLRLSREIEPKPLAIFILGELAVEAPSPQMGGVARAPVERGDASAAFALELIEIGRAHV